MDDATKKDREERDARLVREKAKIEASVRKHDVAEWTTHAHIVEWQEQVPPPPPNEKLAFPHPCKNDKQWTWMA